MAGQKHIHQYKRKRIGADRSYVVYACVLANCTSYQRPELLIGKKSLCNDCGDPFELTSETLTLASPVCKKCRLKRSKSAETIKEDMGVDVSSLFLDDDGID